MTTAKEAHAIASGLLEIQTKKQTLYHIGEWNDLMLYLEAKIREEESTHGNDTSKPTA